LLAPAATPLYSLVEVHFDEVRGRWVERYEWRYGFWCSFVGEQGLLCAFVQMALAAFTLWVWRRQPKHADVERIKCKSIA
jgi:hypothetical protein